ncbi:hypothetical protein GPECTOR_232g533 [Gonium pectorale]|uniref:Uncharacterized protein n=1 Tax=Gonium pectorale TaxID=33097 RepID=A0A150FWI3_GONPE|nr:hypothetical protein GPECTOR_232g533 [Gonium pectorale]|eukprot:KXZ41974.1 hypothetical protein GPECTOR_232g533 [Gonium pectorale]
MSTFIRCMPELNRHVKGIARVEYASTGINAHCFSYSPGRSGVRPGDNQTAFGAHALENPIDTPLVILHYIGSIEEWRLQVSSYKENHVSGSNRKSQQWYEHVNNNSNGTYLEGRDAFLRMPRRPRPATIRTYSGPLKVL